MAWRSVASPMLSLVIVAREYCIAIAERLPTTVYHSLLPTVLLLALHASLSFSDISDFVLSELSL